MSVPDDVDRGDPSVARAGADAPILPRSNTSIVSSEPALPTEDINSLLARRDMAPGSVGSEWERALC